MKAVGYRQPLPIDDPAALEDLELPAPTPGTGDVLVRIQAISVNPVDTKVRSTSGPAVGETAKVLGWDAVGLVETVGHQANKFKVGDRIWYAGSIIRPGCNSELHVVDQRIASLAPTSLDDAQAAALPLTAITAFEILFDRLQVGKNGGDGQTLLVVGGAGGVGSILIQLARTLTRLRIIATASRSQTRQWCLDFGAHAVIDHTQPLSEGLKAAGVGAVDMVASLTATQQHYLEIIECLKPQGQLALIDDPASLDATALKRKSLSLHWELMFTRPMFNTPDINAQGTLLAEIAALVDAGRIRTTMAEHFGSIAASNLKRAHALIESGKARGKVVLQGF